MELEVRSDLFSPLSTTPVVGIVASTEAHSLIKQLFEYGQFVEDGTAGKDCLQFHMENPNDSLTATFYFGDQTSGLESLFNAIKKLVAVEPVEALDWHQVANEFHKLLA